MHQLGKVNGKLEDVVDASFLDEHNIRLTCYCGVQKFDKMVVVQKRVPTKTYYGKK